MVYKSGFDWDAIIEDFRIGVHIDHLVEKYGISKRGLLGGLRTRGLTRNAATVVRERSVQRADEQTLRDAAMPINVERVEALAEVGANIITRHRRAIGGAQQLVNKLLTELNEVTENRAVVEERLVEYFSAKAAESPLQAGKYMQELSAALGAISLASRSKVMLNLASAAKTLIELERKAHRLDEERGDKTYEDYLKELHEKVLVHQVKQQAKQIQHQQNEPVAIAS